MSHPDFPPQPTAARPGVCIIATPASTAPKIAVLMATYQGERFLAPQVESILRQQGVDVRLIVSDDGSTDATPQLLAELAAGDPRVTILPPKKSGSSAGNFFRLVRDAELGDADAVAFSDQDDLWVPHKLARHSSILLGDTASPPLGGVSSDVTPFGEQGRGAPLGRGGRQRLADYVFDSAGPGSTYVLSREAFALVREQLLDLDGAASHAPYHDWLVYALVRAAGYRWHIDEESTVDYRQHDANVLGAQSGFAQNWHRFQVIARKEHRAQTRTIVEAALKVATDAERPRLEWLEERIAHPSIRHNLELARRAQEFRRSASDRYALQAMIATGVW